MALDTVSAFPGAAWQASVQVPRAESGVMPRVLIAHSNKSMRQLIKLHLVCGGYDVTLAEDAVEAGKVVLRAETEPPSVASGLKTRTLGAQTSCLPTQALNLHLV